MSRPSYEFDFACLCVRLYISDGALSSTVTAENLTQDPAYGSCEAYMKHLEQNLGFVHRAHSYAQPESIAFPSGAVLKTQSGQIVDRVEPEKLCEPLTWNTRTPFDPFKGYEVFSGFEDYTCPTQDHPTQRLGEASDPLHASAFLKG
jgi:hypothetical protein